jgi:hypothetical protein
MVLYLLGRTAEAQSYSPVMNDVDPADSHPARREMLLVFKAFLASQWGNGGRQAVRPASAGRTGRQRVFFARTH